MTAIILDKISRTVLQFDLDAYLMKYSALQHAHVRKVSTLFYLSNTKQIPCPRKHPFLKRYMCVSATDIWREGHSPAFPAGVSPLPDNACNSSADFAQQ